MDTITKTNDSHATQTKVAAFKSRVFKLIKLYTEKAPKLNPLLESISFEVFAREPEKMNEIVLMVLNKQPNLDKNSVHKLLEIYKIMLLFKAKPEVSNKLTETFVRMLKKVIDE